MCLSRFGKGNSSMMCLGPKQRPSSVIFTNKPLPTTTKTQVHHDSRKPQICENKSYDDQNIVNNIRTVMTPSDAPSQDFQEPLKLSSSSSGVKKDDNDDNPIIIDVEVPIPIVSTARELSEPLLDIKETPPLPSFKDEAFAELFRAKLKICHCLLQFSPSILQYRQKQIKLNTLIEIQNFFDRSADARNLSHALQDELFEMLQVNLFQQDPFLATRKFDSVFPSDVINPAWPHLSIIYSILTRFIAVFPNYKRLDFCFAKKMIRFMNSPDINERVRLSAFLKAYFAIHPSDLPSILSVIQNQLIDIITGESIPYCAVPMLSFLSSILATSSPASTSTASSASATSAAQTATPLSEDVRRLIRYSVIPLIISPDFNIFQASLFHFYEVALTIAHPDLLRDALRYLIYCWPRNCGTKQPGFVQLMILVFGRLQTKDSPQMAKRMFLFFAQCIRSPNEKTSESTLKMWSLPRVDPVVSNNPKVAMITMYDAVLWASNEHWSPVVRQLATSALTQMKKLNLNLFLQLRKSQKEKSSGRSATCPPQQNKFLKSWALVTHAAAEHEPEIDVLESLKEVQNEFSKIQEQEINLPTVSDHDFDIVTVGSSKLPMLRIK